MQEHSLESRRRPLPLRVLIREYVELGKPRVVALIVFTAIVGMFLAVPGLVPLRALIFGTLGIGLAAASAAGFNQILDRRADAVMARTRARPLPTGQLTTRQATVYSIAIGVLSMFLLVFFVNPLTAILTFLTLIGYSVIYTLYLKWATPQNIVIGGAAGAAPPVLGWVAVTGHVSADALLLFLIIFVWTPPHFWALALYRRDEYAHVELPMLPVIYGEKVTRIHIFVYSIVLTAVTLLPFTTGMSGWIYLIGTIPLDIIFLYYAWRLFRSYSDALSRRLFVYSIQYLSVLFALLLVDHYEHGIVELIRSILS